MGKEYFEGIDILKGLLIILVILGHMPLEDVNENIFKYLLYSFHMPLFLSISGFLIRKEIISGLTIRQILKKYSVRMLIPWCITVLYMYGYLNFSSIMTKGIDYVSLAQSFAYPYGCLWFIPTLFGMIILLWSMIKARAFRPRTVLLGSFFFSVLWLSILRLDLIVLGSSFPISEIHQTYTRIISYFIFFYLGFYIRNHNTKKLTRTQIFSLLSLAISLFVLRAAQFQDKGLEYNYPDHIIYDAFVIMISGIYLLDYFRTDKKMSAIWTLFIVSIALTIGTIRVIQVSTIPDNFETPGYVFLSVSMIILALDHFRYAKIPKIMTLSWIGKNSLPVYLWHLPVILIFQEMLKRGEINTITYYALTISSIVLFMILIKMLLKRRVFKLILNGQTQNLMPNDL